MKHVFTLILFFSFISSGISDPKKPKPNGCTKYSCNDWAWKNGKGLFNPHTIQFPLHYTGEIFKDKIDGGNYDIDVVFGYHGKNHRLALKDYRNSIYYSDPWFLDEGIKMNDHFICKAWVEDEPKWKDNDCAMIQAGYEDLTVEFDGPGCSKIIREWTVIDWCKYVPNSVLNSKPERYTLVKDLTNHSVYFAYGARLHDIEHDGWYSFQQVIKVLDVDPPHLAYTADKEYDLEGDCHAKIWLKNKVVDYGPCPGKKTTVEITVKDYDGDVILSKWLTAYNDKEFNVNLGYLGAGWYKVHYHLKDGCNNVSDFYQKLHIIDKNPPHLICLKDLSTTINSADGVAIWAKDFVHKATGPCYDNNLTYSFQRDSVVPSMSFFCPDGPGVNEMEVFVTASNGVQASCNVTILVADHYHCVEDAIQIAGKITTKYGSPIVGAEVAVMGDETYVNSGVSNKNGIYEVKSIPLTFKKATVNGKVKDKSLNGLDALDLILILRHAFDIEKLDKIDQRAAADVNSDGIIDMEDYWSLTDIIYDVPGRETEINAWKFYDEKLRYAGFSNHMTLFRPVKMSRFRDFYDLIGVKTGDVNHSWRPEKSATARSIVSSDFYISVTDENQVVQVDIPNAQHVYSVSMGVETGEGINIYGVYLNDQPMEFTMKDVEGVRSLIVMSTENIAGEQLEIKSSNQFVLSGKGIVFDMLTDEAGRAIDWNMNAGEKIDEVTVNVQPNPFNEQFRVSVKTEIASSARVEIYDATGRLLTKSTWSLEPGINEKAVDGSLFRSGLHIMRIVTGNEQFIKRIIKN